MTPNKVLYTYHEAREILGFPTYNAVRMAVRNGKIQAVTRATERRKFIHRDEILRVVGRQNETQRVA